MLSKKINYNDNITGVGTKDPVRFYINSARRYPVTLNFGFCVELYQSNHNFGRNTTSTAFSSNWYNLASMLQ